MGSKLRGTGAFATVDTFDARSVSDGGSGTPSAELFAGYHAVLVCSNIPFGDAVLLGDRLAAYHDQGGGVVVAMWANQADTDAGAPLRGAYTSLGNGYVLMDYAAGGYTGSFRHYPDALGDVLEPQSPLMAGVTSLSASHAWRITASPVAGRGVVVARWAGGGREPLVLRGTRGNRTLVELNFYPPSSSAYFTLWTGDGANLMRNALKFSRCMPIGAGTFASEGEGWRGGGVGGGVGGCSRHLTLKAEGVT